MNLAPVIARIHEARVGFALVGGAAAFDRAMQGLTALPAAFVLPARETAGENAFMGQLVQQEIAAEFAVLIAHRNLADDEGAAAVDTLERTRLALRNALLGWPPFDGAGGCEYVGGELVQFDNGVLWWQDRYTTSYVIRSNHA